MDEKVKEYLEKYSIDVQELYKELRELIYNCSSKSPEEKLWAKIPSYYVGEAFIRLIPFKDHINIEAKEIMQHKEELAGYKITPKGMLQVYIDQTVPTDVLMQIVKETLC